MSKTRTLESKTKQQSLHAKALAKKLRELKRGPLKKRVNARLLEFKRNKRFFNELCFCLLTANFNAERSIRIQNALGNGFSTLPPKQLAKKLKELGHRFPNARAKYIHEARLHKKSVESYCKRAESKGLTRFGSRSALTVAGQGGRGRVAGRHLVGGGCGAAGGLVNNEFAFREWLVANVKGLGWKEASHFLRNVGFTDVAIIDFHILDLLARFHLIKSKPKTLNKKTYLEIESVLRRLAKRVNMNLAELDLYLWFMETGKILK